MANASEGAYVRVFIPVASTEARTTATATRLHAAEPELTLLANAAIHKITRNEATYRPSTSTLENARHAAAAGIHRNHCLSVAAIHSRALGLQNTSTAKPTTYSNCVR